MNKRREFLNPFITKLFRIIDWTYWITIQECFIRKYKNLLVLVKNITQNDLNTVCHLLKICCPGTSKFNENRNIKSQMLIFDEKKIQEVKRKY